MPELWKSPTSVRVTNIGIAVYPPGASFGPRKMKDHEFVWIMDGEATVHFDQHKIDAPAGTVLLCRPGMNDTYEWSPKHKSVHAYFHFDLDSIPKGWPLSSEWPLAHHLRQDDLLRPLFRYVLRTHPLPEPLRSSLLLPTVDLMLRSFITGNLAIATAPFAELPGPVEKVLKMIRDISLQEPSPQINLTQLARVAHVTPEHLCRLFRQSLNLGPLECVRLARLERAATLLGRSNLAIKEITESTGFTSPYHFSRRFSQVYGLSPRAYRQAMREGREVQSNPISKALLIDIFSRLR